ncbi:MAG: alpha-glucosidase C-terminal domain-containing protein [Halioglobus sp.]|nr:alpha-glucosidase C-terminal domain-containing protein [Halioglobus sp.]
MYEQEAHSLLNTILDDLEPDICRRDLRHFYTRLGANFYAIYTLFNRLYGQREDFEQQLGRLVEVAARQYIARSAELRAIDQQRERDHEWFLGQQWVGMAMYLNGFANDLDGLARHLPYLQELGVNMVHVLPIMECPAGASDGGYAVNDFRNIMASAGTMDKLREVAATLRKRDILLTLDVVLNHTSNEHEWARRARAGEKQYQDYYYLYDDRTVPDMFEETMPEVFPQTAPGNFTYDERINKWVMTVFNEYQWDLNYSNPAVLIEMLDIILYWANQGADILRLDAVAFLWKKIGTTCQNEQEAHIILQLLKDCCQVTAPGVLFIAEAIVAPTEIIKYFGEDAVIAKECEIAYNASLMALLWDAVATKNARLLNRGILSLPDKLDRATWLNYIRCHDDIGLGFDDADIRAVGYDPHAHRQFLVDYYTGAWDHSPARGQVFGFNAKTGDARISGSLASLAGLQDAIERDDEPAIASCIELILTLHGLLMSFGGIPLLYYGDEVGTLNNDAFMLDADKAKDSRWLNRPTYDWSRVARRRERGTVEQRIFDGIKRLIAVRKSMSAFADFNNRELIAVSNDHLFVFTRNSLSGAREHVLVVTNFNDQPQPLDLGDLRNRHHFSMGRLQDAISGESPAQAGDTLMIPPYRHYWLVAAA